MEAASNYIIGQYGSPLETINFAYPIGICVQYNKGLLIANDKYAMYTCNDAGTVVTRTEYDTDSTCTTAGATTTPGDSSATAGEMNSFNCNGQDDYTVTVSYQFSGDYDTPTCCEENDLNGPIIVSSATNICFKTADDTYSLYVNN